MSVLFKLLRRRTIDFLKRVIDFCEERNIPKTVNNYLTYKTKESQYLPDSFKELLGDKPVLVLANSRTFLNMLESLDEDFRNDIMSRSQIKRAQAVAITDPKVKEYVVRVLGKDFIFGTK